EIQAQWDVDLRSTLNEARILLSQFHQPKQAKWVPVLAYVARVSSLSCALAVIILMLFCVGVELFRPHLTLIGPVENSGDWEMSEKIAALSSAPPREWGSLSLIVFPFAEVYIDDQFYGSTPMGELS